MADQSKKDDANIAFAKLQRAKDGKKALSEYDAEGAAVRAKTERLRALRLARDAANENAPPAGAAPGKTKPAKKNKEESASLSEWLGDRKGDGLRD